MTYLLGGRPLYSHALGRDRGQTIVMRICQRVVYWGRVQGVGFRYTARGLARGFAVAGFVRNLQNGLVELKVEGDADEVSKYLGAVADHMADFIQGHTIHDEPIQDFADFTILS